MHFLLDANMPRAAAGTILSHGHQATDVRDIGLGAAADHVIAALAQTNQYCLLSRDFDFADVRNYPPGQYYGIVVFDLPTNMIAPDIAKVVEFLLGQTDVLSQMLGRLAIVSPGRIRLRPPIVP